MPRFVRVVPLLLLLPFLAGMHTAEAMPTSALPAFCNLAANPNRWQGLGAGGGTDQWEVPANWSRGVPDQAAHNTDVCIPSGGQPRIRTGEEEHLRTLDLEGTLTVDSGGKLFLYGSQAKDQDSVVRGTGLLDVTSGTFGGIAKLHVLGGFTLRNDGSGAATLLVRDCAYFPNDIENGPEYPGEETCTTPPTPVSGPKGLIEVAKNGVLNVRGGPVNLGDQFRLLVRGLLQVTAPAYIAADHGTRLELAGGTLRFKGDGGYLEGKTTAATGIATMSALVNSGQIEKTAGTGRALISAAYSQPSPGHISVQVGTLLLPTGSSIPAQVGSGVTYGTGSCVAANSPDCTVSTNRTFQQSAQLQVPVVDTTGANVVVDKLATKSTANDLGRPFLVHAGGLDATKADPAVITMRFDATVLNGKHKGAVDIYRKSGTAPYRKVRDCTAGNTPPTGEVACVDRDASRNVANTSGAPDVSMLIRTVGTSRWVGR